MTLLMIEILPDFRYQNVGIMVAEYVWGLGFISCTVVLPAYVWSSDSGQSMLLYSEGMDF